MRQANIIFLLFFLVSSLIQAESDIGLQEEQVKIEKLRTILFDYTLPLQQRTALLSEHPEEAKILMRSVLNEVSWCGDFLSIFVEIMGDDATEVLLDYLEHYLLDKEKIWRIKDVIEMLWKNSAPEINEILRSFLKCSDLLDYNTNLPWIPLTAACCLSLSDSTDDVCAVSDYLFAQKESLDKRYHNWDGELAIIYARCSADERLTKFALDYLKGSSPHVMKGSLSGFADAMADERLSLTQKKNVMATICSGIKEYQKDFPDDLEVYISAVNIMLLYEKTNVDPFLCMEEMLAKLLSLNEEIMQYSKEHYGQTDYERCLQRCENIKRLQSLIQERIREINLGQKIE